MRTSAGGPLRGSSSSSQHGFRTCQWRANMRMKAFQVAKETYLTMCIDERLKAELLGLAIEQGDNLTDFIQKGLRELVPSRGTNRRNSLPKRQPRGSYLNIWINAELKARLQLLADEDYRNLTDFVEVELQRVVADYRKALISQPLALPAKPQKDAPLGRQDPRNRLAICITPELRAELEKLAESGVSLCTKLCRVQASPSYLCPLQEPHAPKAIAPAAPRPPYNAY